MRRRESKLFFEKDQRTVKSLDTSAEVLASQVCRPKLQAAAATATSENAQTQMPKPSNL